MYRALKMLNTNIIYASGTTGKLLKRELGCAIHNLESGPLCGDQQIGAKIVENKIDFLIFFRAPLSRIPTIQT